MGPPELLTRSVPGSPQLVAPRRSLAGLLRAAGRSWATRSLAVGAIAALIDVAVGAACVHGLGFGTRLGAMLGVAVGGAFAFFANRHVAFREHNPALAKPALKFLLSLVVAMAVHGQLVVLLRDHWGVPFIVSKLLADVAVFTFGQLLLLRFVVFPKARPKTHSLELPEDTSRFGSLRLEPMAVAELGSYSGHSQAER